MDSCRQAWGTGFVFALVDVGKTSQWFIGRSYVRIRADGAPDSSRFDVILATGKEGAARLRMCWGLTLAAQ